MAFLVLFSRRMRTSMMSACNSNGAWTRSEGWAKWSMDLTTSLPRKHAWVILW
jgi:hypothetical protein